MAEMPLAYFLMNITIREIRDHSFTFVFVFSNNG
jgi:hypothetical protein